MRDMNIDIRNELIADIQLMLTHAVGAEYCKIILDSHEGVGGSTSSILADIIQNILECSALENEGYYSEDDVRLAIGRVLMERIGIDY